jgi:hypothetical protein
MELEQLQSLRDRVALATGESTDFPDDLNYAIAEATDPAWVSPTGERPSRIYRPPTYNSSIDAALAWVERVGCYMISLEWDRLGVMAHVGHRDEALNSWKGNAPTPALAIILAGLDALIAQEKTDGTA